MKKKNSLGRINGFEFFEGDILQVVEEGVTRDYLTVEKVGDAIVAFMLVAKDGYWSQLHPKGDYQVARDGKVVLS